MLNSKVNTFTLHICCDNRLLYNFQIPLVFIVLRTPVMLIQLSPFTSTVLPSRSARRSKRGLGGATSALSHFTHRQKTPRKEIRTRKLLRAIDCDQINVFVYVICVLFVHPVTPVWKLNINFLHISTSYNMYSTSVHVIGALFFCVDPRKGQHIIYAEVT